MYLKIFFYYFNKCFFLPQIKIKIEDILKLIGVLLYLLYAQLRPYPMFHFIALNEFAKKS